MKLASASFADGGAIPAEFAFCAPDPGSHATLSKNRNPQLSWSEAPGGTRSFALPRWLWLLASPARAR